MEKKTLKKYNNKIYKYLILKMQSLKSSLLNNILRALPSFLQTKFLTKSFQKLLQISFQCILFISKIKLKIY